MGAAFRAVGLGRIRPRKSYCRPGSLLKEGTTMLLALRTPAPTSQPSATRSQGPPIVLLMKQYGLTAPISVARLPDRSSANAVLRSETWQTCSKEKQRNRHYTASFLYTKSHHTHHWHRARILRGKVGGQYFLLIMRGSDCPLRTSGYYRI